MPDPIVIVTPVWNDASRLAGYGITLARAFADSPLPLRWIIADDGSSNAERKQLEALQQSFAESFPDVSLHLASAHRGKGAIIREAWNLCPDAAWLAFADADGAVSATDLLRLVGHATTTGQSVIGIRKRTTETTVTESALRSIFHHGYLTVVHLILGLRSDDLQCGAKVIRGDDYRRIAHLLEEDGFAFDTELLATLHRKDCEWLEVPVTWAEQKGGKVRPFIDAWRMFKAVIRIRQRHD